MKKRYYEWMFGIAAFLITFSYDVGINHPMACFGIIWGALWIGDYFDSVLAAIKGKNEEK